jgi:hypothetical protein
MSIATNWLSDGVPAALDCSEFSELRVDASGDLVVRDWYDHDYHLVDGAKLFDRGPCRALVLYHDADPCKLAILGEGGGDLIAIDLNTSSTSLLVEIPRFPDTVGGMCYIETISKGALTLLTWELGLLALGTSIDVLWRHDLEWNHQMIHIDEKAIWFDLMYESSDIPQRIGEHPWGYSLQTGRELLGDLPPA